MGFFCYTQYYKNKGGIYMSLTKDIQQTDLDYTREFTSTEESKEYILFKDLSLPDMDHHNFMYIKEGLENDVLQDLVDTEIRRRQSSQKPSAFFISDFKLPPSLFKDIPYEVTYYSFDYMAIEVDQLHKLRPREDVIFKEADTPQVLEDGIAVDIEANTKYMGDFAKKRIKRKVQIYTDKKAKTSLYVGYYKNKAIGNCELFVSGPIAKMEDFDILEAYQRRGFGTAFVKYILEVAKDQGAKTLYIVTDSDDTAKDMYSKCYFSKFASKHEVYIDFSKKGR